MVATRKHHTSPIRQTAGLTLSDIIWSDITWALEPADPNCAHNYVRPNNIRP